MDRRHFARALGRGAAALGLLSASRSARALFAADHGRELYERALTVDAMCFTTDGYVPLLDADRVAALAASGITAISLDVSIHASLLQGTNLGRREFAIVSQNVADWNAFLAGHADRFLRADRLADVERAKREGKLAFIFNMQDTAPIAQSLNRVRLFHDLGIRQIQLSHDQRNFAVDSCWEHSNAGLSRFGHQLVEELNRQRILIDVAHVGETSTLDTLARSAAPVIASHTGCLALAPHPRNKSDELIRALAEAGGVLCLYNMSGWMTRGPEPSLDVFLAHLRHAIDVAGEDHVGFGTDGDPARMDADDLAWEIDLQQRGFQRKLSEYPQLDWQITHMRIPELDSPQRLLNLVRAMEGAGYAPRTIEKVIGRNYLRAFREAVG